MDRSGAGGATMIRALIAWLFREHDLTEMPLPLYLRRAQGERTNPPAVSHCSDCGTVYMTRPIGSERAEDGKCYECSTGHRRPGRATQATAPAKVLNMSKRLRGER